MPGGRRLYVLAAVGWLNLAVGPSFTRFRRTRTENFPADGNAVPPPVLRLPENIPCSAAKNLPQELLFSAALLSEHDQIIRV